MHFEDVGKFHLLWLAVISGSLFFWFVSRKYRLMNAFAQDNLIAKIAEGFDRKRLYVKNVLLVLFLVFSVIALARPQWGYEWQEVKRQAIDIIVAIDVSKSMLTADVKPNRLERTKLAVKDLIKKLNGDRIGLIAFAGDAFMVCPLTVDYSGFILSLNDLSASTIPKGGTAIDAAIKEAIRGYEKVPSKYKAVIILTDGENLEGDPISAAEKAKAKGMKIYCVGIGTQEGELVRIPNEQGEMEFLKDSEGNFIKSRLNEDVLKRIAFTTNGVYARARGAQFGLDVIYDNELSKLEKRDVESRVEKKYFERFQIPLMIAFCLLFIETILPEKHRKKQ